MGMIAAIPNLTPAEAAFLQALLWEEGQLLKGPATLTAEEHGLSLIRCLEPANRLSPNLQGKALNHLRDGACPIAAWPWDALRGDEVLRLLWSRLAECRAGPAIGENSSGRSQRERAIEAKRLA